MVYKNKKIKIPVLKNSNKPIGVLPNGFKTTSPLTPDKTVQSLEKRTDFTKNSFYNIIFLVYMLKVLLPNI